jgi:cytochrome c oxidase subunit 2
MKRLFGGRLTPGLAIALGLIVIVTLVTLIASLTVLQLPDSVTEQGDRVKVLYAFTLAISMIVFVLVTCGIIWALFRYKRKSPDDMPEQIHGSSALEFAWTIIPIIILVGLFIPSLILVVDLKSPPSEDEADIVVEAIGHQWWWEFVYPETGIRVQATPPNYNDLTPPALVIPVDQTVLIKVRSTDVVHSFSAPQTLYKIQAVPGNVNYMHLKVEDIGVYHGQCYQFCGLRHADMLFVLDARSQADYDRWVQDTRRAQGLTDSPVDSAALPGPGDAGESE